VCEIISLEQIENLTVHASWTQLVLIHHCLTYFNNVSRGYLKEPHSFYRQTLYAYSTQPISLPPFRTTNNYQHAAVMGTTTRKVRISDLYQKNVVRF